MKSSRTGKFGRKVVAGGKSKVPEIPETDIPEILKYYQKSNADEERQNTTGATTKTDNLARMLAPK